MRTIFRITITKMCVFIVEDTYFDDPTNVMLTLFIEIMEVKQPDLQTGQYQQIACNHCFLVYE